MNKKEMMAEMDLINFQEEQRQEERNHFLDIGYYSKTKRGEHQR